jgi:hypothetical protein
MYPLRENLGHDVDNQEGQGAKGNCPMSGLGHHPVSRGHDNPVGRDQTDGHRCSQPDEREHPGVEQHEVLRSRINVPAGLGHDQSEDDHGDAGDQRHHNLRKVLANCSLCSGVHTLAAACTADGRWHASPPAVFD